LRRVLRAKGIKPREAALGVILTLTFLAVPIPSVGQQPAKAYRIGRLSAARPETDARVCPLKGDAFWQTWIEALRERGYVQGRNLVVDCRYTAGRNERAAAFAAELVNLKVDLIVAVSTNNVRAVKEATSAIPIVMHGVIDPVRRGLVGSLSRPGGNVTGLADDAGLEILGKYLGLLLEAVPGITRVATIHKPDAVGDPALAWERILDTEARILGVRLQSYHVRDSDELEGAFSAMTKGRAQALLVIPSSFFVVHAQRIVDFAARNRLPAMYPDRQHVELGGLMAYAVDDLETARRVSGYVDRILKGAKPGDLPVEQPTKFELIINLKTAKTLGLTIPPTLLMQAEVVIR
jgi:putative ABC transport system substrate-binding protein